MDRQRRGVIVTSQVTTMPTETITHVGPLLRDWRRRRRMSQLDLALEAGVSARHLSFVETGKARPSADMLLHLADQLDVPLRDRNRLLLAAGYAPAYGQRGLDDEDMSPIRGAIEAVLKGHEPNPALVVDRHWGLVAANDGLALLTAGVDPGLLEPPVNVLRVGLHPKGLAPRIINHAEWRAHLLGRLERQVVLTGDPAMQALLDELAAYPYPAQDTGATEAGEVAVALRLRAPDGGELSFVSTVTTFGTPVDVTVAELAIESFFPADDATAAFLASR